MFMRTFCATIVTSVLSLCPLWADSAALQEAMSAISKGDWEEAAEAAELSGDIALDIVEWHRLRAGRGTWDEYRAFLARRPDWPGLPLLVEKGEQSIPLSASADDIIEYFDHSPPETGRGLLLLAQAWKTKGEAGDEEAIIVSGWLTLLFTAGDQAAILAQYKDLLAPYHEQRLDMLLWRGAIVNARAMLPLVNDDWGKLTEARIGLRQQVNGVDALIAAVPEALADDPGLAFERFNWRARKGRNADAIELLLSVTGKAETLGEAERWATWRANLARWSLRQGRVDEAYRLASEHHMSEGSKYADLEWLSGFIALRFQEDPAKALRHFRNFRVAVFTPISLGRAGYWEGRAHEAMGNSEGASVAYSFGGEFQTSFYGLLAAEKAGMPMDATLATGGPAFPAWNEAGFASSSVLEAGLLLQEAGERLLATRFLLHLSESFDTTEQFGQLSELALELNEPYMAVSIAKAAARQNIVLPRAYFPVPAMFKEDMGIPAELALAIARRESEFNPVVVSGAGARGLMQLMPGTAQDMARALELEYSRARLTTDPDYNAKLGSAYLKGLIERFGTNWPMVAAGYNAGPSRPQRWAEERGHPGSDSVDVIDWIELIPFNETRNYVMRVTESLPVYRARLSGETAPLRLSEELKGR